MVNEYIRHLHTKYLAFSVSASLAIVELVLCSWNILPVIFRERNSQIAAFVDSLPHPPCEEDEIPHYTAFRIDSELVIDGRLDEPAWKRAPRSERFRDLVSGTPTIYSTHAAVLWDNDFLYVGYWVEEPNLQASLTQRDAPIYQDNDVELFVAGDNAYYEFEINAYGTIYEVFFIWEQAYVTGGYHSRKEFSLDKQGVRHFNGVGYKHHPKGKRIGFWNWDLKGLQSAVTLDGSLNDNSDVDQGWYVELALPWSELSVLTMSSQAHTPPRDGDIWRMDFSRFNQYKGTTMSDDSGGWAWSPHGVWDSHIPECFTYIHFSDKILSDN